MSETQEKKGAPFWKRLLFSRALEGKNQSHTIAYIAVVTAFVIASNMFFEFKLAETQFSLTLFISALAGLILGPLFGFVACFLGDLIGFLYHSAGFAYMPWIGLSLGLVAFIAGVVYAIPLRVKGGLHIRTAIVAVTTFLICTVGINTTGFWLTYSKVPYTTYLISRLFVQGQIWNSVFNYALLFAFLPVLQKVKPLKLNIG